MYETGADTPLVPERTRTTPGAGVSRSWLLAGIVLGSVDPAGLRVARAIRLTHAAFADLDGYVIGAEAITDVRRHERPNLALNQARFM